MQRSAPRPSSSRTRTRLRMLACAAVPLMVVAAGCSSDSEGPTDADKPAPATSKAEAKVAPAKFATLPADLCKTVSAKTVADLVPATKDKSGSAGKSSDITTRGSCSWNGLDDNGVKGSQYRWLDVSFMRYDSDATLGSGQDRAASTTRKWSPPPRAPRARRT